MAFSLIPQERYRSIYEIDPGDLHKRGISLLLLDLDNTIAPYHAAGPEDALHGWIAALRKGGVEPFILSNSRKEKRVPAFAEALGVPFLRRAGKPKKEGFLMAMKKMGKTPEETAMVGDQIFTDILGANRSGVTAILVNPKQLDNPFRVIRYGIETPFRSGAQKKW